VKDRAIYQLAFTLPALFDHMMRYEYPGRLLNLAISVAYFLIPGAVILWAAAFINWRRWTPRRATTLAVAVVATLAPLTLLAIAWDLSRFLAWSSLAAAIGLLGLTSPTSVPTQPRINRPSIHALILNAALLTVSVFYLLSPTIFAYVSEVGMSYSSVPKWFAATAPARITARIFDRYNANPPRAVRFRQRLSCFLIDGGAKRNPGCTHEIRSGQRVYGPQDLKIASGLYSASFVFTANDVCSSGAARLQVATTGRFGRVLADYHGRIDAGRHIELPFRLSLMDAALAPVEFRAIGAAGCVRLSAVDWTQMPSEAH
jgi:hypothetical protein